MGLGSWHCTGCSDQDYSQEKDYSQCKKAKWLSEEALQIAEKRRDAKGKGKKERYIHFNAIFQRIARRDKKAFLSNQCKEIEENNRLGKTRDLFKKIRDTNWTFHAKISTIEDRNGTDLTEAKDIKRWQKYTEKLYKKDLHDPDNHARVVTHLEPDILECEVKWALGSITTNKASGGDRIPVELFQILKEMLWKSCTQHANKSGKLSSGHRTGKHQFLFQSQRKAMPKNFQTTEQLRSSHKASNVMLNILQARLQQYMTLTTYVHILLTKINLRTQYPNWNRLFIFPSEAIGFNPIWLTALFIWIITIKWAIMF